MKYFIILFTILASGLIIFNLTQINFNNPFEAQSIVALITIFTALCGVVLLQILRISKRIDKQSKSNK